MSKVDTPSKQTLDTPSRAFGDRMSNEVNQTPSKPGFASSFAMPFSKPKTLNQATINTPSKSVTERLTGDTISSSLKKR